MLSTIKGYYENGQITLKEEPPVKEKTEVMVTFLTKDFSSSSSELRQPGGLKGKVQLPADFNAPLDDLKEYM